MNLRSVYTFTVLALFLTPFVSRSQTGPGGVGSSTSNLLWLKANEITGLSNGADVQTWLDASGNGNTLSQPTASFSPVYATGVLNGFPAVRFNKTNGRIRRTGFSTFPTSTITAIYVNSNSESGDGIISYASTASNNDFLLFRSENLNVYRGTNIASSVAFDDGSFHIANASWRSSDGSVEVWKDGSQSFTSTGFRTGTSITAGGSLAIAGEQDSQDGGYASNQAHFGDFTEVMIFNTYLNEAQHIIVSNYLAAKYSLTISNDRFEYQSTHPHDVAGIGREDVSNQHTAAMSADILRIENASGLNADQEYLLFGHNDGDATSSWTTTEAPDSGTDIQRLAREWRLDETGDVGTIDLVVETSSMPTLPVGHTMYVMMVDSDGDFSSGASVYEMTLSAGTEYTVTGVDFNDGDYMAIGAVRPTIQHTIASSSGDESLDASIEVSINFISGVNRTVEVTTADVSTTVVDDYTALSGSLVTITAGNTAASYTITIADDMDPESNETLTATLANPSAGVNLGTNSVHTYSIEDNDISRKVNFDAASANGLETVTSVNVGVSLSLIDMSNSSSVDYTVTGGTASGSGTDFTLASGTVNFAAGVTTGSFNIAINNEALYESDETIIITLSNPVNSNLGGVINHTYTINNDDTAPSIQFNSTSSNGMESTSPVNFQVDLSTVSGVDASASFTVTGTALGSGVDYTLANGTVIIPAGSTMADISALIVNDGIDEASETIIITLSATVLSNNASLGTNTNHTYTILSNSTFGFTGPGGVGESSNNILWTRPEELADVVDGTDISTWSDFSGNGNDLTQGDNAFTPRYYSNQQNSLPIVRFDQANGRLVHTNFDDFATSNISVLFVNKNSDSGDGLFSYASAGNNNDWLLFSSNNLQVFRPSSTSSSVAFNDNAWHIGNVNWQNSDGALSVWKDGTQGLSTTGFATGTSITANGSLAIGGEQDAINGGYDDTQSHQGDFAEVIIYSETLGTARSIIIQNYLSAKYDIALTANDVYDQDDNGDFDFEVAGIGRVSSSDLHLDAKGPGIVRVNGPQDLDDDEFFMWGHDNALLEARSTDVPAGIERRFERVWRVSEMNRSGAAVDVGAVDISFDLTGLGNVDVNDLVLMIDADGTFAVAATQVTGAIDDGANIYRFAGVTGLSDNMRFTLATLDYEITPLPIVLLGFWAKPNDSGQVEITWETATETDNNFFTIERSKDGRNFEEVAFVEGAGNSNEPLFYKFIDHEPFSGANYYRLKQTDYNGSFEYSELVRVFVEAINLKNSYKVFPNPVERGETLSVSYSVGIDQTVEIRITSIDGKSHLIDEIGLFRGLNTFEIETSEMKLGLNFVRIVNSEGGYEVLKVLVR